MSDFPRTNYFIWNATYKIYLSSFQIKLLDFLTLALQTMLLSSDVHSYLLLVEEIPILQLPYELHMQFQE